MNTVFKSFLALSTAFIFVHHTHAILWTAGHGDIGFGYDGGLEPHWHLGEGNESVTLDGVSAPLGPDGGEYLPNGVTPVTDLFQQVGLSGPSYYVFPEFEDPTVPYIGFGTEELDGPEETFDDPEYVPTYWDGFLTLELTGATGPGDFYMFITEPDGTATTEMDSSDGFSSADSIDLAPDAHTHRTLAFTQQGEYDLTFQISGTLLETGETTSASAIYSFSVIPEPSTAGLLLGAAALALTVVRRRISQ